MSESASFAHGGYQNAPVRSPNLSQANIVLGLVMHVQDRSDPEPDGLLDGMNVPTKGMNMRINESRNNCATGFAVSRRAWRDCGLLRAQLFNLSICYNNIAILDEILAIEDQDVLYHKGI